MTDPMELLRATNPVRDCDAPGFDRLLARLEREVSEPAVVDAAGRRPLAALLPVAVALAVAAVAIVSLHGGRSGTSGPHRTTPATGSLADTPGQARGRVVPGSMHRFTVAASGARNSTWGAEWFRMTDGQICVQAGREVRGRLGYVDIDGIHPADGRFHPWPANTAVDARCITQPAHGGIVLTVAERVADSGFEMPASGVCMGADRGKCPARDTTTLYFGILGAGATEVDYGTERHSEDSFPAAGPGIDGEYIQAFPVRGNDGCSPYARCVNPEDPRHLVHPGSRAFVLYAGSGRTCLLDGPGTDGVMSGRCRYGLTLGRSPMRLTAAQVRTPVHVTTKTAGKTVRVTARFRTRVASSRLSDYSVVLTGPPTGCPGHASGSSATITLGDEHFRAGEMVTRLGSAQLCTGTYHGAVVAQPLVGPQLTVDSFSFRVRPRR